MKPPAFSSVPLPVSAGALVLTLLATACDDGADPAIPPSGALVSASVGEQTTHRDDFSFLPPIARSTFVGTFDGSVEPTVVICELTGAVCGPVLATFTRTSGTDSERIRVDEEDEVFIVDWHTGRYALDPAADYRISVLLGFELGWADIDVLGADETPTRPPDDRLDVRIGSTLPIKFVIGEGVLSGLFVRVSAGVGHSCALDGEGEAWCWGDDFFGQLGYGTVASEVCGPSSHPCNTTAAPVAPPAGASEPLRFVEISAGNGHTCALQASGSVWCWGLDADGQLGDGPATAETCSGPYPCSTRPVQVVASTGFTAVDAGRYFTCAVAVGGAGYCWGFNGDGQLGTDQSPGAANVPIAIHPPAGSTEALSLQAIASARLSACAVATDGTAWCWGRNTDGQLGNGGWSLDPSATDVPVAVAAPLGATQPPAFADIDVSSAVTCARTPGGAAWCWGFDPDGPEACLNPCTTRPVELPGAHTFDVVGPGCGLDADGVAWCWPVAVGTPASVPGHTFVHLDHEVHTCAAKADGSVWCWGDNTSGQLGDGTTTGSATPVEVVVP